MGGTEALNGNFALKKLEIPVRVVFGTSALRPSFSLSQLDESRSEMVTCHLHLFLLSATRPAALTQATRNAKYNTLACTLTLTIAAACSTESDHLDDRHCLSIEGRYLDPSTSPVLLPSCHLDVPLQLRAPPSEKRTPRRRAPRLSKPLRHLYRTGMEHRPSVRKSLKAKTMQSGHLPPQAGTIFLLLRGCQRTRLCRTSLSLLDLQTAVSESRPGTLLRSRARSPKAFSAISTQRMQISWCSARQR